VAFKCGVFRVLCVVLDSVLFSGIEVWCVQGAVCDTGQCVFFFFFNNLYLHCMLHYNIVILHA